MELALADLVVFLEEDLGIETRDVLPESALFSSGIIDSFSLLSLMSFLEERGGFRFDPGEVTLENLDTLERVLRFYRGVQGRGD